MHPHAGAVEPFVPDQRSFEVTFDYRCPFARNAHEHVLDGLEAGADWDVRFVPFSLSQAKEATWSRGADSALEAFELAIAVRDTQPDRFLEASLGGAQAGAACVLEMGMKDDGPAGMGAAGRRGVVAVTHSQASAPSSASLSSYSEIGATGITVEIACL